MRIVVLWLFRFSAMLLFLLSPLFGGQADEPTASALPFDELEKIAKAYRIDIAVTDLRFPVKTTHGMIDGKNPNRLQVRDYINLFATEFAIYPVDFVRRSQLKRIVLCSELSYAGQRRNAVPDFEHDSLYFDVSNGTYHKLYLRKVIHHEFFHVIDYRDDGNVYLDEHWASFNIAEFKYGNGGRSAQDQPGTSILSDKFPGFLNHYSTTAVEEDKSEVFANLIVDPKYVESQARLDRVLDTKVGWMKELLAKFCPEMNNEFWTKVRSVKRPEE